MSKHEPKVIHFLPLFMMSLMVELLSSEEKWGDTWLQRPRKGQALRIVDTINSYYENWNTEKKKGKFPYLSVAGLAVIGWIRDNYTDVSEEWEDADTPQGKIKEDA